MREHCHRCQGELPERVSGNPYDDDGAVLFCPRCGAPQILLLEHMRAEAGESRPVDTTGASPPPRPAAASNAAGRVDWRAALTAVALVAGVGAALELIGLKSNAASFLSLLWTISGSVIALGLYARHRPRAWMDARVGLRVGVATGLMLAGAMGLALAVAGVTMRFGTHSLAEFDAESARELATNEALVGEWMQMQTQSQEIQQKFHGMLHSPEVLAGDAIAKYAFVGLMVLAISAGGGAFAGLLRATQSPRRAD